MRITFFLILCSLKLLSQNGAPVFEFNSDFKDQACSFKDLTGELFREERKKLHIKSIQINIARSSMDSLYFTNKEYFNYEINNYSRRHTPFSLVRIYNYDEYGFLLEHFQYPVCKYLSKADSMALNKWQYRNSRSGDTVTICQYYNDTLHGKFIHVKDRIIYETSKQPEYVTTYDSTKKAYITDLARYKFIETKYRYYPDGKLKSRIYKNKPEFDAEWYFEYPSKTRTIITDIQYEPVYDTTNTYQNIISTDKKGRITKSILFEKAKPIHTSTYSLHYDKMGYLTSIDRRDWYKEATDETNTYYTFDNYYDKSKLVKTIAHYHFNVVENDIQYNFDDAGLIKSIDYKDWKEVFEYDFYKH